MKQFKLLSTLLIFTVLFSFISCGPSVKATYVWVNKEKIPAVPLKSIFIIAITDNMQLRANLENDLGAAAVKRGLIAYKSMDIIGPVSMKEIAPVKDVFLKKLNDLKCESILTIALVDEKSETRYVPGTTAYTPYSYGAYGGYGGYGGYGMYGGFGGYYGYSVSTMSTPGYYTTDKTYFIEGKVFDLKTGDILLSIQSKADNPDGIEKSSKEYTQSFMAEVNKLRPIKK